MNYNDFMSIFSANSPRIGYLFETFILNLLKLHAETQSKKFIPYFKEQEKNVMEFDGLFPNGIDNIIGPIIVEVKLGGVRSLLKFLDKVHQYYPKYKNLLIVVGSHLKQNDINQLNFYQEKWPDDLNLIIWDVDKIMELVKVHQEYGDNFIGSAKKMELNLAVMNVESENSDDWRKNNDFYIEEVNQLYNQDKLVLFLGAGVSIDAGSPSWNALISNLNVALVESQLGDYEINEDNKKRLVELLNNTNVASPLISASYVKEGLGDDFAKTIKESLYENLKPIEQQKTLSTIAKNSHPRRGKIGIKTIITYNFDDLLENHLEREKVKFRAIYSENDIPLDDELPIYHIHGFLPKDSEKYTDWEKSFLVFSEDAYHDLQSQPYSWANLKQINALKEDVAVLIGLSGTDPNLRRLLNIFSKQTEECKHYILLERQFLDKLNDENTSKTEKEVVGNFSKIHHAIQEQMYKSFGLKVIWYEDYKEIPNIIQKITRYN